MVMGWFLPVVIDIIHVLRSVVKARNHPPVSAYGHGPKAFHLPPERVQSKPRHIYVGNGRRGIKDRQNISRLARVFSIYAAWPSCLKTRFSPLWRIVRIVRHRNLPRGACQVQF